MFIYGDDETHLKRVLVLNVMCIIILQQQQGIANFVFVIMWKLLIQLSRNIWPFALAVLPVTGVLSIIHEDFA